MEAGSLPLGEWGSLPLGEEGSLPLGEGGSLHLGEGGSLPLGEVGSLLLGEGMEEGRAGGDQEEGRELKVEHHRGWAAHLLVDRARVVGRMG